MLLSIRTGDKSEFPADETEDALESIHPYLLSDSSVEIVRTCSPCISLHLDAAIGYNPLPLVGDLVAKLLATYTSHLEFG